jgi:hypothetical protein
MQPMVTDEQRAAMAEIAARRALLTPEQKAEMSAKSCAIASASWRGPNSFVITDLREQQAHHEAMLAEYGLTANQAI